MRDMKRNVQNHGRVTLLKCNTKRNGGFTRIVEKDDVRSRANRYSRTANTSSFYVAGFTLVELLVVIAIISLLSSVVLASVQEARESAEKTARLQAAKEVQKALEAYHLDGNEYPSGDGDALDEELQVLINEDYIASLPGNDDSPYYIFYTTDTDRFHCENTMKGESGYTIYINWGSDQENDFDLPHLDLIGRRETERYSCIAET